MKRIGRIVITGIAVSVAGLICHEIIIARLNVSRVDYLCSSNPHIEIHNHVLWAAWKSAITGEGRRLGIKWHSNFSEKRAAVLNFSRDEGAYIKSYSGRMYGYPYTNVRIIKNDLYYRNEIIASRNNYTTYSDVGFFLSAISGGGKVYGCIEKDGTSRTAAFIPELSAYTIPVIAEFDVHNGEVK